MAPSISQLEGNGTGSGNYTEYGRWYGLQAQPWCAMFISWCAAKAGIDSSTINYSALASVTNGLSSGVGSFNSYSFSAVRVGDIISFENGTHVALVVNKTSTYIETVEGNTGNDCVERKYYYTNHNSVEPSWRITHYFRPDYERAWRYENGYYYYYDTETNTKVTGWLTLGSYTYYLDPNNGGAMVTGWKQINGKTYYFDEDGLMQTSWQEIDGNWYYFASSGAMQTGWVMIGGSWHYFNSSGRVQMGWKDYNGDRYYLDPDNNGAALTGTHIIDGVEYTFDEDGALIG